MLKEKISVVISTYNRKLYLEKAIDSVLMQTYQNIEIIIIDDCSTDNTKDIMNKYQGNKKIKYYRNSINKGCGISRKYGVENYATGNYIVFLDDDDLFINYDYFDEAIKLFNKNKKLSMVCAPHIVNDITTNTKTKQKFNYNEIVDNRKFFLNFGSEEYKKPIISVTIIKKEALEFANYHEMKILNDTTIFLRALLYGPMGFINKYSAEYLVHGNNISFNMNTNFIIDNLDEKYKIYKILSENNNSFKFTEEEKKKWLENQLDITIIYFIKGSKPSFWNFRKVITWYKKNINDRYKLKSFKEIYHQSKEKTKTI